MSRIVVAASPDVVLAQLAGAIDLEWPHLLSSSGFGGSKAFVGHVGHRDFRIQCRQKNRNGFAPQLYGAVVARDGGTQIDYKISMHRLTRAMMIAWFVMVGLIGLSFTVLPTSAAPTSGELHPVLWTVAAVAGGILLLAIGRVGWRDDVSSLERFMSDNTMRLDATSSARQP